MQKKIVDKFSEKFFLSNPDDDSPINIIQAGKTLPYADFAVDISTKNFFCFYHQLEYVTSGKGKIVMDNDVHSIEKGDFFHIQKGLSRKIYSDKKDPLEKMYITLRGPFIDGILSAYNLNSPLFIAKSDVGIYFENILHIIEECDEPMYSLYNKISFELLHIIQKVYTEHLLIKPAENLSVAENIMNYIDANFSSKITIGDLCDNFFLCKTQIIKIFKKKYNTTPMHYLQFKRIGIAEHYLRETDIELSALPELLGYADSSHFTKAFKKDKGMTPGEWRKRKGRK